ncbi:hypothetical protein EDB19DRAFT_1619355, partial [Suillus lakei]
EFDSNQNDALRWRQLAIAYLLINNQIYNDDKKKIIFALACMTLGSAGVWALSCYKAAEASGMFGMWLAWNDTFKAAFQSTNTKGEAVSSLMTLVQTRG